MDIAAIRTFLPLAKSALAPMVNGAGRAGQAAADKATEAAKEFESLLLGEMLKGARQTLDKDGGFFGNDKSDAFGALFDYFMGKHLANSGTIGLADSIGRYLSADRPR